MRTREEVLQGMDMVEFLVKCRKDFKFFCERLLGLTQYGGIQDFHMEWFHLMQKHDKVLIQAPSGFAKTTIFEAYALWVAWNQQQKKIMILANTDARSKEIIQDLNNFVNENEIINDLKPKNYRDTWNKQELRTTTGCRIFCKPYTENMRGERVDFALLDEADSNAYNDKNIFTEHVLSRLNPNSKLVLISTPGGVRGLMSYIKSINQGDYVFKKYRAIVNCEVEGDLSTGESIWKERFPLEELLKRKRAMGESSFRKVYMCDERAESEDSIFKMSYIMDCYDIHRKFETKPEAEEFRVIACDFAYASGPKADYDAYVVLEKKDNFFIIKHIETWKGVKTPVKVSRIQELNEQFQPHIIICDESNIGNTVIDEMVSRGLSVVPQKFSSEKRKDLLMTLKNIIENQKLVIPRNSKDPDTIEKTNELTEQLLGFVKAQTESTKDRIDSNAAHDDVAISLAMAVKEAANQINDDFTKLDL